jgi:hypothetical protein
MVRNPRIQQQTPSQPSRSAGGLPLVVLVVQAVFFGLPRFFAGAGACSSATGTGAGCAGAGGGGEYSGAGVNAEGIASGLPVITSVAPAIPYTGCGGSS